MAVQYILKPMNTSIVPHSGSPGTDPIPFPRENSGSPAWKELRWTLRPLRPRCAGDRKARSGACSWTGGAKREVEGRQGKASRNQTLVEPFAFWLKAESHKDFKSRQRREWPLPNPRLFIPGATLRRTKGGLEGTSEYVIS